jgi:hypothetical protein
MQEFGADAVFQANAALDLLRDGTDLSGDVCGLR